MKDINKIGPLCYTALTSFPFIERDFDALTQYELNSILIGKIKELIKQCNDVAELVNELKVFVTDYFENLDITKEINTKIDKLVKDGTFARLIDEIIEKDVIRQVGTQVPPLVSAWLDENITQPDQVVIDSSLSTKGAVAEAYMTGLLGKTLAKYNCMDTLIFGNHETETNNGITYTYNSNGTITAQGTCTADEGFFSHYNIYFSLEVIPEWITKGRTYYASCTKQNDVIYEIFFYKDGVYYEGYQIQNKTHPFPITVPTDAEGMLIRLRVERGVTVDRTVNVSLKTTYTNEELMNNNLSYQGIYNGDVNDINQTGIYLMSGNNTSPTAYGALFHIKFSNVTSIQYMFRFADFGLYYRRYLDGSWSNWAVMNSPYSINKCKYVAFGDSLTIGALWNENQGGEPVITYAPSGYRIPDRIAQSVHSTEYLNRGKGGMACTYAYDEQTPKLIDHMRTVDLTDADLITIGIGRNDGPSPIGTYTDSTDDTICGALNNCIDYIRSQNKKAQIVIIQVTPNTTQNHPWTSQSSSGWTLNDFDREVSRLCKEKCVGYANWYECSLCYNWSDLSGAGGNYAHMKDKESYLQMGNYIAGKVSHFYNN